MKKENRIMDFSEAEEQDKLFAILSKGARTIGGLKRAGITDPLAIANKYPNIFLVSPSAGPFPVISLNYPS
jgi:hypothetical protein